MEFNIVLKNLVEQRSADGSWWRLNCFAENGDVAQIDVQPEDLARLGAHLSAVALKAQVADELPPGVKIESRSSALAVHHAQTLNVVRWEGGGFGLQLQSREGAYLQVRLTPEMVMNLHQMLNREYPKGAAKKS